MVSHTCPKQLKFVVKIIVSNLIFTIVDFCNQIHVIKKNTTTKGVHVCQVISLDFE